MILPKVWGKEFIAVTRRIHDVKVPSAGYASGKMQVRSDGDHMRVIARFNSTWGMPSGIMWGVTRNTAPVQELIRQVCGSIRT